MSVYIDTPLNGWCHMKADTIGELHWFAQLIGLKTSWFQNKPGHSHYDLKKTKIKTAICYGAKQITRSELFKINTNENLNGIKQDRDQLAS